MAERTLQHAEACTLFYVNSHSLLRNYCYQSHKEEVWVLSSGQQHHWLTYVDLYLLTNDCVERILEKASVLGGEEGVPYFAKFSHFF